MDLKCPTLLVIKEANLNINEILSFAWHIGRKFIDEGMG